LPRSPSESESEQGAIRLAAVDAKPRDLRVGRMKWG
jgi:hypothetical protein